jgi:parallel beta-helix repeat protein
VKRSASLMILLLLVFSVLLTFSQIAPVKAEGTIYIREDGTVEGTDKILRDGNIYTFTSDIYGPIVVEKDDVVIDGAGYTLEGNEENMGINLNERSGVKIKNINFSNWWCGIANFGNNCTIEGNWINGGNIGIQLKFADRCTIIGNELLDNFVDVYLIDSYDNNITGNSIGRLVWSMWFQLSPGDNYFDGNYWKKYKGVDDNGDGFGDTPFTVYWVDYGDKNKTCYDNHPLMEPTVIPEFPSWTILPLFLVATVSGIVVKKRLFRNRS